MQLIDTSVWLRAFSGRGSYAERLGQLVDRDEAAGHSLVRGELLMGDRGGRGRLLQDYEALPWLKAVPDEEVAKLVIKRSLTSRGIGWIDAHLLASSLAAGARLWTADAALHVLALELGVAAEL